MARGLPTHVGLIMDGNGRWAKERGKKRIDGHKAGEASLYEACETAIDLGIPWLSAYAFSTENWKRSVSEVKFLMRYPQEVLERRLPQLDELGVRIRIAGQRDKRIPSDVVRDIEAAVEQTKGNKKLNLVLAFNYGGRAEIVDAVKKMIDDGVSPRSVSESSIAKYLYVPEMPDPDLIIRTSNESRTSNFLLWQSAYAEWIFTDTLWPDFDRAEFERCIKEYGTRDRRFGNAK